MSTATTDRGTLQPAVIVGAGIAGLTVALALARSGRAVTLFERAEALTEVGAGLQLSPNAMRVLTALGLDEAIRSASLPCRAVRIHAPDGAELAHLDLLRHRPDAQFRLIHRARLVGVLAAAAQDAGAVLRFGSPAPDLPEAPLLIGTDGLKSGIRSALNGQEVPFFTGQTAWRAIIPDPEPQAMQSQVFTGPGRHLVSYPLPGGLRNLVGVMERREWQDEGWSHPGDPDQLRQAFAGFAGPVTGWLSRVTRTHLWGLFRHEVANHWHDGRQVILGDAAHPSLPFMAQGANMAIEDAWTLAACLNGASDQRAALARFQHLRQPRVTRIVAAAEANARNYHLTGLRRVIAHAGLRVLNRLPPRLLLSRYDWIYDHDPCAPDNSA